MKFFLCVAFIIAVVGVASSQEQDNEPSESQFIKTLASLAPQFSAGASVGTGGAIDDLSSYPYENHAIVNAYGAPPVPQPSFGVAVNTNAILAPHVEVLRLIEAFIRLKGEVLSRLHALINDNWELIRSVLNLVISKLQNLHAFSLKGISIFRKIMEFALNLFADWSLTLPTITFGTTATAAVQPHDTYGIPSGHNTPNFLQGWARR